MTTTRSRWQSSSSPSPSRRTPSSIRTPSRSHTYAFVCPLVVCMCLFRLLLFRSFFIHLRSYGCLTRCVQVQVAMKMKAAGKTVRAGDHIQYVICAGEEGKSAAERAEMPETVRNGGGAYTIDKNWYAFLLLCLSSEMLFLIARRYSISFSLSSHSHSLTHSDTGIWSSRFYPHYSVTSTPSTR